jgi:hypothetical protein
VELQRTPQLELLSLVIAKLLEMQQSHDELGSMVLSLVTQELSYASTSSRVAQFDTVSTSAADLD